MAVAGSALKAQRRIVRRGVRAERMEQIAQAAAAVFSTRGYDKGTLEEVAERVGITRAAVYNYYAGKRQLLESILASAIQLAIDILIDDCRRTADPVLRAETVIVHLVELLAREKEAVSLYYQQTETVLSAVGSDIRDLELNYMGRFTDVVCSALEARGRTGFDRATVGYSVFGMCIWTYKWMGIRAERPPKAVGEGIARLILDTPPNVFDDLMERDSGER
jgi:AcrR family transcriptional regulator